VRSAVALNRAGEHTKALLEISKASALTLFDLCWGRGLGEVVENEHRLQVPCLTLQPASTWPIVAMWRV
jgi:hypothetical protein